MSDPRLRVVHHGSADDGSAILGALDLTVEVRLPAGSPEWRHQLLALTLVELLGRLCPRIGVTCAPDALADPRLPPGPPLLAERIQAVRGHGIGALEPAAPVVKVAVGDAGPADVHVDADGWLSYVGTEPSELVGTGSSVPVGPLLAAARAGAQVVARLLEAHLPPPPPIVRAYSSALSYRAETGPFAEETPELDSSILAVMAGAGSIGGAAVYLLAHVPGLRGELDIVDPQQLEERNFVRAILATRIASANREAKANIAVAALRHLSGLEFRPHSIGMAEFVARRPREAVLPLVLSPVDSIASRREVQDCLPLEVINGACDPQNATISGHVTGDGPCLYCLHLPEVLDRDNIKLRLMCRATGFRQEAVLKLLADDSALSDEQLRQIETARGIHQGALAPHAGETLNELYRSELMYGEIAVGADDGSLVAVASPFVTALAGFFLAGEALKAQAGEVFRPYRLGARGDMFVKYAESVLHGPEYALRTNPSRWDGSECLCRSSRRLRLLRERYSLVVTSGTDLA